ncbi:MAG TPA: AI-2E family transporter [Microlunatus sp.]
MTGQATETARVGPLPRALTILLGLAAAVVVIMGARELAWLIGPVFLALVIVLLVHPLHTWLRHKKVPEGVALVLLLLAIFGVLIVLGSILVLAVARLVTVLPQYAAEADGLVNDLREFLISQGISRESASTLLADVSIGAVVQALTPLLSGAVGLVANAIFLLSLMLFLGIDATGALGRMAAVNRLRPRLGEAFRIFSANTRRFLGVTTIFAVITGVADTLLLLWLDIPLAILWGLLAAICNYIPYVGFVIGLLPPAILALLIGDWPLMLVVIVAFIVLNSLFTSLIQPYFVGDAVGVSMPVTLVALVFWGWVLGPLGAILAIPLTLLVKAILVDTDPSAGWAIALFGSTRAMRHDSEAELSDRPETEPTGPADSAVANATGSGPDSDAVDTIRTAEQPTP